MPLSLSDILALVPDNTSGDVSPADMRDVVQALHDWIPPLERYKMGRLAGETAHASDDFFTSYSGYTEFKNSGTAVWTAGKGGLTCKFNNQTAGNIAVAMKAVPSGPPLTIETLWNSGIALSTNPGGGMLFSNGVIGTSTIAEVGGLANYGRVFGAGTINSLTSTSPADRQTASTLGNGPVMMRLIWKSANVFQYSMSPDGENWVNFSTANQTPTMTPTHMGFWVSSWGNTSAGTMCFRYLRVYAADLSV